MDNYIKKTNRFYNSNANKIIVSILLVLSVTVATHAINPIRNITQETQVIYVFDNETKELTHILSYDAVLGKEGAAIIEKFENSSFFTGFIEGDFKENDGWISPKSESMFVVLRDNSPLYDKDIPAFIKKEQDPGACIFYPVEEFSAGDDMSINLFDIRNEFGRPTKWILKVEVMKNDNEEIVLKVL